MGDSEYLQSLVASMPRRMADVIERDGGMIKYKSCQHRLCIKKKYFYMFFFRFLVPFWPAPTVMTRRALLYNIEDFKGMDCNTYIHAKIIFYYEPFLGLWGRTWCWASWRTPSMRGCPPSAGCPCSAEHCPKGRTSILKMYSYCPLCPIYHPFLKPQYFFSRENNCFCKQKHLQKNCRLQTFFFLF